MPVGVATYGSTTYVFAVGDNGVVTYWLLDTNLNVAFSSSLRAKGGLPVTARAVSAGYAAVPGKPNAVYVSVDPSFRIRYFTFQGGTLPTASGYETSGATVTTAPALTTSGQLYVKGFDGKIYTKTLDAAGGYSLVSGL